MHSGLPQLLAPPAIPSTRAPFGFRAVRPKATAAWAWFLSALRIPPLAGWRPASRRLALRRGYAARRSVREEGSEGAFEVIREHAYRAARVGNVIQSMNLMTVATFGEEGNGRPVG